MKYFPGTLRALLVASILQLAGCDLFMSADAHVARAEQRIAAQDYPAAVIELRNALKSDPEQARAHLLLAQVLFLLGDPTGARKELDQTRADIAGPPDRAVLSARIALELGEFRELLTRLDGPQSGLDELWKSIYRGRALSGLHQPAEAAAAFESALATDPRAIDAHTGLAEVLAAQGQPEAALVHLDAALAIDCDDSAALLLLGNLRARQGDYGTAEEAFKAARTNAPTQFTRRQQAALLAALTETQLLRGRVDAAAETRAALSRIAPEAVITRVLTARIVMARQDYPAASAELQRVVDAASDLSLVRVLLGA